MDEYTRLADEYLTGTRGSGFIRWHDDRIGTSHAVIISGEVGDPLGESNLWAASSILGQWLDDDGDVLEATVGRSGRTWLRTLAVRVYEDDGTFTDAWRTAVDLVILPLEDYAVLHEDDYAERQWETTYDGLVLDYGDSADLVVAAISEVGYASPEDYLGDHDEVVQVVENYLALGKHGDDEPALGGLRHYIRQRKDDLDIPTLAALVG
jgi:hypothetical protein